MDFVWVVLFVILLSVLSAVTLYFSRVVWPHLQRQLEMSDLQEYAAFIDQLAKTAVAYAEQIGDDNADKKRLAVAFLERELAAYGLQLDPARIDELIEATVFTFLNRWTGLLEDGPENE